MIWLALLIGCFENPDPVASDPCTDCHGTPETGSAPPAALGGFTDPSNLGVGSHQAHVLGTRLQSPVACGECHLWPDSVDAEGHIDTPWPAEVGWGELGKTGGLSQAWDREAATCTVYCHGSTLGGGVVATPEWTSTDGSATQCGACHGSPPPPPHSQNAACSQCHGQTTPDTHINGKVECWTANPISSGATNPPGTGTGTGAGTGTGTGGTTTTDTGTTTTTPGTDLVDEGSCNTLACSLCHGTDTSAAPPPDSMGQTDTSLRSVGAHDTHLAGTASSAPVGCWACHIETHGASEEGHIDLPPAEVVLQGVAAGGGIQAAYNEVDGTCTTWCHGSTAYGGTNPSPTWTSVGTGEASCGSCHGLPPGGYHPADPNCDNCHPAISPTTHVNGIVDL